LKKRKRKPGILGQTTTMNSNDLTSAVRMDGPHHAASPEEQPLDEIPQLPDPAHYPELAASDDAPLPLAAIPKSSHDEVNGVSPVPAGADDLPLATIPSEEPPATPALAIGVSAPEAILFPLEERIRKLEVELAALKDTRQLESRVAARVSDHIAAELAPAVGTAPNAGLGEIGKRLLTAIQPPAPRTLSPRPPGKRPGWLLLELLAEARVILRMYLDPRYRMTWVGRLVPIVMLLGFLGADSVIALVLPIIGSLLLKIPVMGFLLEKMVELVFAYVLFKVLTQEARRYRETSPDLPASLRL
jgi:hypothetical protein